MRDKTSEIHTAVENGDISRLRELLETDPGCVNIRDEPYGFTPLQAVIYRVKSWHPYGEIMRMLLEAGADVNAVDQWGQTPLHLAASCHNEQMGMEIAGILLTKGADIRARDLHGCTAIGRAIAENHKTTADWFSRQGAKQ